ncbi:MAG: hypothetical protein BWK79_01675, partial [Beggiatoa sp. IS2]
MDPHFPLRIKPHFSKKLAGVLILLHGSAGILLWLLALSLIVKCGILGLIFVSLSHSVRYHLLLKDHPLKDCILNHDQILLSEPEEDYLLAQTTQLLYFYAMIKCARFLNKQTFILELERKLQLQAHIASDSYLSPQLVILRVSVQFTGYLGSPLCRFNWWKSP